MFGGEGIIILVVLIALIYSGFLVFSVVVFGSWSVLGGLKNSILNWPRRRREKLEIQRLEREAYYAEQQAIQLWYRWHAEYQEWRVRELQRWYAEQANINRQQPPPPPPGT
jgi:hypothetical protein